MVVNVIGGERGERGKQRATPVDRNAPTLSDFLFLLAFLFSYAMCPNLSGSVDLFFAGPTKKSQEISRMVG